MKAVRTWWQDQSRELGTARTLGLFSCELWEFVRDSTPERRRRRFGDMEYDWQHRVDTTSGTVGWRERLLGTFLSAYQPTEPAAFREMLSALGIDFREFTFVDVGSGKGRTLLMASEYPFRRIVGVEIMPELHGAAIENLKNYRNETQRCFVLEAICADAREFTFPLEPMVVYLFNPLPESGLRSVVTRLDESLAAAPRPVYVVYYNPILEHLLSVSASLTRVAGTPIFSIYAARK